MLEGVHDPAILVLQPVLQRVADHGCDEGRGCCHFWRLEPL